MTIYCSGALSLSTEMQYHDVSNILSSTDAKLHPEWVKQWQINRTISRRNIVLCLLYYVKHLDKI